MWLYKKDVRHVETGETNKYIHTPHLHNYIRTYIHTYIRTYIHTYVRTYVHTTHLHVRTCTHTTCTDRQTDLGREYSAIQYLAM